jgi:hypothetical protein
LRDSRLPQRGAGSCRCPRQQTGSRRRRRSTRSLRDRSRMRRGRSGRSGCRPRAGRRGSRDCRACRGRGRDRRGALAITKISLQGGTSAGIGAAARSIDGGGRAVTVQRRYADGRLTPYPKTARSRRRVPLTVRALDALDGLPRQLKVRSSSPARRAARSRSITGGRASGTRPLTRPGSSAAAPTTCGIPLRPKPWLQASRSLS